MEKTSKSTLAQTDAYCLNQTESLVQGVATFGNQKKTEVHFESCWSDPGVADPESTCLSNDEVQSWLDEASPVLNLIKSFSFIDYDSQDEAFKQTITQTQIG